jgi:four helix bundle protein
VRQDEYPIRLDERLFRFAVDVVRLCQKVEKQRAIGGSLARQLLRSGTSIGANYQEGQGGHSRADFVCKTTISLKEARETVYWLRLIAETCDQEVPDMPKLINEAKELVKILGSIVARSRAKPVNKP